MNDDIYCALTFGENFDGVLLHEDNETSKVSIYYFPRSLCGMIGNELVKDDLITGGFKMVHKDYYENIMKENGKEAGAILIETIEEWKKVREDLEI